MKKKKTSTGESTNVLLISSSVSQGPSSTPSSSSSSSQIQRPKRTINKPTLYSSVDYSTQEDTAIRQAIKLSLKEEKKKCMRCVDGPPCKYPVCSQPSTSSSLSNIFSSQTIKLTKPVKSDLSQHTTHNCPATTSSAILCSISSSAPSAPSIHEPSSSSSISPHPHQSMEIRAPTVTTPEVSLTLASHSQNVTTISSSADMASPAFTWGATPGAQFQTELAAAYEEIVFWKKICFIFPQMDLGVLLLKKPLVYYDAIRLVIL